jgi:hypothetical protein
VSGEKPVNVISPEKANGVLAMSTPLKGFGPFFTVPAVVYECSVYWPFHLVEFPVGAFGKVRTSTRALG